MRTEERQREYQPASGGRSGSGPAGTGLLEPRLPPPAPPGAPYVPDSPACELALFAVTVAAVVGLVRLFADWSFLPPVLLAAAGSHAITAVSRRLRLGLLATLFLSALGLVLTLAWVVVPSTTWLGIPTAETWRTVTAGLQEAWRQFGQVAAPAEVNEGFVLACAVGTWMTAFAADLAAFRVGANFEAVLPPFTLFVFGTILGAPHHRIASAAVFLGALLLFLLLWEAGGRPQSLPWVGGRGDEGRKGMIRAGLALGLVTLAVAVVAGPRLPGAEDTPLVNWRNRNSGQPGSRVTVSPLVDIRSRLLEQANLELFTVRTAAPDYWRLTSLDRFDGTIWSSQGSYDPVRNALPAGEVAPSEEPLSQQFNVSNLASIWLPAAYRPQRFSGPSNVRYDADSSSLLTEAATSDGLRYTVQSLVPRLTASELMAARESVPEGMQRYLSLPRNFPARVRNQANALVSVSGPDAPVCVHLGGCTRAEVASGRLNPYHRAKALQDWLRMNFAYDERVPPGHDQSAIERFLFVTRRGYCEQFAGSFAAMARAVGLPARVAVGFTPGALGEDGLLHVRGRQAHAWPEVYLAGNGWVAFEPTPGRGVPGGEGYTGVRPPPIPDPGGAEPTNPTSTPTTPTTAPGSPSTTASPGSATPTTTPQTATTTVTGVPQPAPGPGGIAGRLLMPLLIALAAAALVGAVPLARSWRRRRRWAAARTGAEQVLVAWEEAEEALALAGLGRRPWETATEYADRVAAAADAAVGQQLPQLARDTTAAIFSGADVGEEVAARARRASAGIQAALAAAAGPLRRALWALDPRPLLPRQAGTQLGQRLGAARSRAGSRSRTA